MVAPMSPDPSLLRIGLFVSWGRTWGATQPLIPAGVQSMLHNMKHIMWWVMPRGSSGRVVVEVSPELKNRLYRALSLKDITLKEWFINSAEEYIAESEQPSLLRPLEIRKSNTDHR